MSSLSWRILTADAAGKMQPLKSLKLGVPVFAMEPLKMGISPPVR